MTPKEVVKTAVLAKYTAIRGSNIQCLSPTVGQCTTSLSVSATTSWGRFDTVPYSLRLVPDRLYGTRAVSSVVNQLTHFPIWRH